MIVSINRGSVHQVFDRYDLVEIYLQNIEHLKFVYLLVLVLVYVSRCAAYMVSRYLLSFEHLEILTAQKIKLNDVDEVS